MQILVVHRLFVAAFSDSGCRLKMRHHCFSLLLQLSSLLLSIDVCLHGCDIPRFHKSGKATQLILKVPWREFSLFGITRIDRIFYFFNSIFCNICTRKCSKSLCFGLLTLNENVNILSSHMCLNLANTQLKVEEVSQFWIYFSHFKIDW